MIRASRRWLAAAAVALATGAPPAPAAPASDLDPARAFVFAVLPQAPPVPTRARWLPVVEELSRASGVPLQIRLYQDMDDFNRDLAAGNVDFAYVSPVQMFHARRAAGYEPILRDDRTVRGVFVVAADSPAADLGALAHREVAFIARWTFCSARLAGEVKRLGITPRYVGTAANAYKSILLGEVSGAGMLDVTLADAPPEVRSRLRVVYETPPMAAHALIAHPRVGREPAAQLRTALLAMARQEERRAVLRAVRLEAPVVADYARDYASLETILDDGALVPPRRP